MASRPATSESQRRPGSTPESQGVGTIAPSETRFSPTVLAEEVAEGLTFSMFDNVLNTDEPSMTAEEIQTLRRENNYFKLQNEQLQAQLASARSEKEEVETRHRAAQSSIEDHRKQIDQLTEASRSSGTDLKATNTGDVRIAQLEEDLASSRRELTASQSELANLRQQLSQAKVSPAQPSAAGSSGREQELEMDRNGLREHVTRLDNQLTGLQARYAEAQAIIAEQSDLAMRKDVSTAQPTMELPGDSSEEKPLLAAAYQQISVLNTQLAHLYTELTMARTEVQRLRSEQSSVQGTNRSGPAVDSEAEVMKQSQQIADLVSDIRHLQLDLEYHQQKLDQMIEEKQQMMRDLKKAQVELDESKRQVEERDQMLKHREVDLRQMKEEMKSPRSVNQMGEMEGDGTLAALRAEAAAKDSALIVSHYELHKEKLLRDRLEQKNLKLMERMQKLMMVVETMRKENVTLERNLVAREQNCETKEQQLRQVTQKAKQLQKIAKAAKAGQKGGSKTVLEMQQALPPLDRSQRSMDSQRSGRGSGASTPRTPRAPPSPYGTR